ncbi:unnamed protein product [Blepharisma stoltei]|uniref:Uncharacterized protein n=1 Tax=Blepharisma stoltei TaxID=1481888 RepID=A0AAU9KD66_9CILI|nr:unnamed protein product [Blepharisma stoltei]
MLNDNELHMQVLAGFQREPTVTDKYGVHFEYQDLFSRLMEVKIERESKAKALDRRRSVPKNSQYNRSQHLNSMQTQPLTERIMYTEISQPKKRKPSTNTKYRILRPNKFEISKRSISLWRHLEALNIDRGDIRNRPRTASRKRINLHRKSIDQNQ